MLLQQQRKKIQPSFVAFYEFKIQEIQSYPSQRVVITEQNIKNYANLRIGTYSPISCKSSRIKTQPQVKKEKIIPFEHDYNTFYRTVSSQRNLFNIISGKKK
ncbi:unnamed protein product [Paramecium pentaurelia]|uniref:Uncharacterized protein n=1 Tax=Paramecium pentaurelia TaxID=43138 RepID=A0A8S1W4T0_9CILI|nr:unnamed protein product [Paramecium pentaurelia]